MPLPTSSRPLAVTLAVLVVLVSSGASAQIPIRNGVLTLIDFDDMGAGSKPTLPQGVRVGLYPDARVTGPFEDAASFLEYKAGDLMPATAAAGTYNFGAGDSTSARDRAPGFLLSNNGKRTGVIHLHFVNETGVTLSDIHLVRQTESYRNGTGVNITPSARAEVQTLFSADGVSYVPFGGYSLYSLSSDGQGGQNAPFGGTGGGGSTSLPTPVPPMGAFYIAYRFSVDIGGDVSGTPALALDNVIVGPDGIPFTFYIPTRLDRVFGERVVGSGRDSLDITLERPGAYMTPPEPTVEVAGQAASDFTIREVSRFSRRISYRVYFSPTTPGERNATLTFRGTGVESRPVTLRGTGRAASATEGVPEAFTARTFPHPSRGPVTIETSRPLSEGTDVAVFDGLGRVVARLTVVPGATQVSWDGSTAPAGVYVVRMTAGSWTETARVVVIR